jgi:hypothetical protein
LPVGGATDNLFTIETNAPGTSITATTKVSWITNLTKSPGAVAADGSSTWTIGFDVTANKTTYVRSGNIEVTIGGIKKTVSVSQVGVPVYVSNPSTPYIMVYDGHAKGLTFTIETNSTDLVPNSLTTTDNILVVNLKAERSVKDAANGIYLWTVTFDLDDPGKYDRTGFVSINISGITKTVEVRRFGSRRP